MQRIHANEHILDCCDENMMTFCINASLVGRPMLPCCSHEKTSRYYCCPAPLLVPILICSLSSTGTAYGIQPCPVSQVADDILYIREAIANIAARHALVASFVPKPFPKGSGSGAHVHLSMTHISDGSDNLMGHVLDGLSSENGTRGESFMAGILQHLPGLCLFTLPSPLSYERIKPGAWSGAYR